MDISLCGTMPELCEALVWDISYAQNIILTIAAAAVSGFFGCVYLRVLEKLYD